MTDQQQPPEAPTPLPEQAPEWCTILTALPGKLRGCAGSDVFEGHDLAVEAWGEDANYADSGLTAFAYLWRRFGPPTMGSDPYKDLCRYLIGTPMPGVYLMLNLKGSPLAYGVGYTATEEVHDLIRRPEAEYWTKVSQWAAENGHRNAITLTLDKSKAAAWEQARATLGPPPDPPDLARWREIEGPVGDLNRAVFECLREMLRPVYIRDVYLNIFGTTGEGLDGAVKPSKYAGLGIAREPLDALLRDDDDA